MSSEKKQISEPVLMLELGNGLEIWKTHLDHIYEQDRNAQVQPPEMFERLTETIKAERRLESLPFVVRRERKGSVVFEMVSGHHRTRAARAAGLMEIYVLADSRDLNRSKVVAKQIAHNSISGKSDDQILAEMLREIDDPTDMLESFVDPIKLGVYHPDNTPKVDLVGLDFDFKVMSMVFLSSEMEKFDELVKLIPQGDVIGVVDESVYKKFQQAVDAAGRQENVRNLGAIVGRLVEAAAQVYGNPTEGEWVPLGVILKGGAVPPEAAEVISSAIEKMKKKGEVTEKSMWKAIELWAADYLASSEP